MNTCPTISLNDLTDLYLIHKNNEGRKYHKQTLVLMQQVFAELFTQTWYTVPSRYMELKKGDPYNYIDVPVGMQRLLSVSVPDRCGNMKPLFYNQDMSVIKKPKRKPCGCESNTCDCAGLCEAIGGLVVNTKEVVIINPQSSPPGPQTYTEYQWLKYCPNGDIYEYRQVPTLQYEFSRGSYDDSYDVSYEIGDSSSSVIVVNLSRKLCSLEVAPCGCPAQNQANEELFFRHCGCFINTFNPVVVQSRNRCWDTCTAWAGEVKLSDCGTKIFVKWIENIEENHHLLVSYQTNGVDIDGFSQVPNNEPTKMCMYAGVEYRRMVFNDRYNLGQKREALYQYEDKKNELIKWLNPLSTEWARSLPTMAQW